MNEFGQAADNYTKSTEIDDQFVFSHIQLAVAQYKSENLANSMATFRRTLKAFPTRSEPQNYYGELLLDQQRFQDAVEKFDRAIELEKEKYAMPLLLIELGSMLILVTQTSSNERPSPRQQRTRPLPMETRYLRRRDLLRGGARD